MFQNFQLFNRELSFYSLLWLTGVFVVGILACRLSRRYAVDENDTIVFMLVSSIGMLFGGHLLYGLTNYAFVARLVQAPQLIGSLKQLFEAVVYIFGGSVFYGGLLGGILAGVLYCKKTNKNTEFYAWLMAPLIPLFHFFGRLGCFLSGCCYGVEAEIGFIYRYSPIPQANGVVRFPVQLVEAGYNLALFFLLTALRKKPGLRPYLLHIYVLCYAVFRFLIEFYRGDALRGVFWGISTSQIISILLLLTVPILLVITLRRKRARPEAALLGQGRE